MNYFGHIAVAKTWLERSEGEKASEAEFIFGAALPDLANMARSGLSERQLATLFSERAEYRQVARGLHFHVQTDAVFHALPGFTENNSKTVRAFREKEIRRGPARAMAHVGVEMQIDAHLSLCSEYLDAWLGSLQWALTEISLGRFPLGKESPLFKSMLEHLLAEKASVFTASKARFSFRLGNMLKGRARLEPTEDELQGAALFLEERAPSMKSEAFPIVEQSVDKLLEKP